MAAAGLLGAAAGLGGGYLLARHRHNSWGDGEVMRMSTVLGVWSGTVVGEIGKMDFSLDNRPFTALLMAGGTAGLVGGDWLVRRTDFSVAESIMVDLTTVAGGLLGAGILYPIAGADAPFFVASGLGAGLGFTLGYLGFRGRGMAHPRPDGEMTGSAGGGAAVVPLLGRAGARGLALAGAF
jgi:hypothetical protein